MGQTGQMLGCAGVNIDMGQLASQALTSRRSAMQRVSKYRDGPRVVTSRKSAMRFLSTSSSTT